MSARDVYQLMIGLITPRPIAWVTTVSARGIVNLAPFSFFSGVSASPPTLAFSCVNRRDGSKKDTIRNLEVVPEFVVNLCSYDQREAVNESSAEVDYEVDELALCGLTPAPSQKVRPPCVAQAPAHLECKVHQIVQVGEGPLAAHLVIGEILLISLREDVLTEKGSVDSEKLDTIGRMGGIAYTRTRDVFELLRPTQK